VWKVLSFGVGLSLVYLGAFIYEGEQKNLQNRLEDLWLKVDDLNAAGLKKRAAFMVVVAQMTTSCFDAVFGPSLISLVCFGASMAYALAYACLLFAVLRFAGVSHVVGPAPSVALQAAWGLLFLLLGNLRLLAPRLARFQFWLTLGAFGIVIALYRHNLRLFSGGSIGSTSLTEATTSAQWIVYVGGIGITIIFVIAFIAVTRWLVRWSARSVSFVRISTLMIVNLLLAFGIMVAPGALLFATLKPLSPWPLMWAMVMVGNSLIALVALAFFFFAVLMLVHQLFWPLLSRPLYFVANERLLTHRKALISTGLALMGAAVPSLRAFVKQILG
jgi:hypothetical protein